MTEAEILFPVQCPVCAKEALSGFRISVVSNALRTGEIRLYASCHAVGWEASAKEIYLLHEYLEAGWSEEMQEACRQIDLENSTDSHEPVFVHTEMMEQLRMNDATAYLSAAPAGYDDRRHWNPPHTDPAACTSRLPPEPSRRRS